MVEEDGHVLKEKTEARTSECHRLPHCCRSCWHSWDLVSVTEHCMFEKAGRIVAFCIHLIEQTLGNLNVLQHPGGRGRGGKGVVEVKASSSSYTFFLCEDVRFSQQDLHRTAPQSSM